ncbi:DUF1542 domain-containing protein [Kineothrix sp. MSJ-39]|uniref:DUF1542 domain-containing protein n=1 Tax=Kineothrix sp. MSJ-39 TaxID=2841533 RepID=UPI001C0FD612|nr:DUF1542 domain-containing protein [Kineothrix sp. MSJ-39]MBU5430330.1 DUF1542 domain-containing protein [Kineothrix sp. MSJ-39]
MNKKIGKERIMKRLLSSVLALVMVFTLIPVGSMTTYAADENTYIWGEITQASDLVNGEMYVFTTDTYSIGQTVTNLSAGAAKMQILSTIDRNGTATNSQNYGDHKARLVGLSSTDHAILYDANGTYKLTTKGAGAQAIVSIIAKGAGFDNCNEGAIKYINNETYPISNKKTHAAATGWIYSCYYDWCENFFLSEPMHIYLVKSEKPHTHTNHYDVTTTHTANDTLIWYCGETGCTLSVTKDNPIKLSLSASSQEYTGNVVTASYGSDEAAAWEATTENAAPAITYYKDEACTTKTTTADGASGEGAAPANVGVYYAAITAGGVTAKKMFEITKADASANLGDAPGLVYDGTEKTLVTASPNGGTVYYKLGKDGTWSTEPPKGVSAEESYTVYYYVKADSNHNDLGSEENPLSYDVTIEKAIIPEDAVKATPVDVTYNKKAHTVADVQVSGLAEGATVTYSATENGTYTAEKPVFTDVKADGDAYTVYYKVSKPEYADKYGTVSVMIRPKRVGVTWGETAFTYNGEEQVPSVSANDLIEGDACEVTVSGAEKDANQEGGSYTAQVTGFSNKNYTFDAETAKTEYTIAQKEIGIEWGSTEFVYNAKAQKPEATATGVYDNDVCNITVSGEQTNAGSYHATASALDNDNYKLPADISIDFVISPKTFKGNVTITLTAKDGQTIEQDENGNYYYTWDDTDKEPVVRVIDNDTQEELIRGKDYTVTGDQINNLLGDHKIRIQGIGNYGTNRLDRIDMKWSIVKSTITPVLALENWTYGDSPKKPVLSGATINGDVTYTYYTKETCEESEKTTEADGADEVGGVPKNAGIYWVQADIAETEYYQAAKIKTSFTIERKPVTVVPLAGQSKIYGEADPEIAYEADVVGNDKLTGALKRRATGEDVGNYEITEDAAHPFSEEANPNYKITVQSGVTFAIERKTITADMITISPLNYAYDKTEHTPELFLNDKDLVAGAELTENDIYVTGDTSASDYGVYTIRVSGRNNYKGVALKKWCVSPVKDTTVPYNGKEQTLSVMDALKDGVTVLFRDENGAYTLTEAQAYVEPGKYTYEYQMTIDEGEEEPVVAEGQAILTIEKLEAKPEIVLEDSYVYGDSYEPAVENNLENGEVVYEYFVKDGDRYTSLGGADSKPVDTGSYMIRATVGETAHYKEAVVEKEFKITKKPLAAIDPADAYYAKDDTTEKTVELDYSYRDLEDVQYRIGDVQDSQNMLAHGSVTVTDQGVLSYTLSGAADGDADAVIPVLITSRNYQDVTVNVRVHIDVTAPDAEITIADETWKNVLNKITFGMFFKESKEVTIRANDSGIGLGSVQYYVANAEMTEEQLRQLESAAWTDYTKAFSINPDSVNVVYAKVSDLAGNTRIIGSDGVVIYTDSEQDTDSITYTRTAKNDVTAKVILNGNTVKSIANGETVLIPDTDYTVAENGEITFKNSYLSGLKAQDYTLTVSYNPQGKEYVQAVSENGMDKNDAPATTEIALHVLKAEGIVADIEDLSKEYDAKPVNTPQFSTTNDCGTEQADVSIEYKAADAEDADYTTEKPVDAGKYRVRITVKADDDYLEAVGTSDFEILPKQVFARVIAENKVYDGTVKANVTATVETGIAGQELKISDVAATFADADAAVKKAVRINNSETIVTAANGDTKAENYNVYYPGTVYADITARKLTAVKWGSTTLVYSGRPQAPAATAEGLLEGDVCDLQIEGAQTDTNEVSGQSVYTAIVTGVENTNYELPDNGLTCEFTIINAEQEAPELSVADETILNKKDGQIKGLSAEMEYRKAGSEADAAFTKITDADMLFAAGTYEVRMAEKPNYNASPVTSVEIKEGRKLTVTLPAKEEQIGYSLTSNASEVAWQENAKLTLKVAEGYSKTENFAVVATDVSGKSVAVKANEDDSFEISGIESDLTIRVIGIADITAPTGEITVAANKWSSFLETITFGKFFKEKQDVVITAEDAGSGVKSVRYYLADQAMTEEAVNALEKEQWKTYEKFSLAPDQKAVVYARLEDQAGNVKYLSSDGMVFDAVKPVISGVEEGAELYTENQYVVTVTDDNLDRVYVTDGSDSYTESDAVTVTDGAFALTCDSEKVQKIIAVDKAGNSSAVSVSFVSLTKIKSAAKEAIDQKAEEAKQAIDALPDLTEQEKKDAKEAVDQKAQNAKQAVEKAEDRNAAADKQQEAEAEINGEAEGAKQTDLANAKAKAIAEVEKKAEEAKQTIDALPDLTEEQKKAAKAEVAAKAAEAKEAIEAVDDPSRKAEVAEQEKSAEAEIGEKTEGAKQTDLANAKAKAIAEVDAKATEAKKAIDALTYLTEAEKEAAKAEIDKQAEAAKKEINAATDRAAVTTKVTDIEKTLTAKAEEAGKSDAAKKENSAVTPAKQEKNALAMNAGLKVSQKGKKVNIEWGRVKDADGYRVYVQYCGKKFTSDSAIAVTGDKNTKVVVKKVNGAKLDLKKNYKIYVEAYKTVGSEQVVLGKTITAHIVGRKNAKATNVKQVKVEKSKVTLKVGKKSKIKGSTVLVDKNKKPLSNAHAKELRYATSNKRVATVTRSGKIKAVGKGSCTIYVYARNGYAKKVKVTVK